MTTHPRGRERRQHVRVRPTADFEVGADVLNGIISEPLQVLDLSLGGLGLLANSTLAGVVVGDELKLNLHIPQAGTLEVVAVVRHISMGFGVCGLEFREPSPEVAAAVNRAVSDLLERGAMV